MREWWSGHPVGREQLIEVTMGGGGQAFEDVGQPDQRVEVVSAAVNDHGVMDRAAPACLGMADEQPVFLADTAGPDRLLDQVLITLTFSILDVGLHIIPLAQGVADRFAQGTFEQDPGRGLLGIQFPESGVDAGAHGHGLGLAVGVPHRVAGAGFAQFPFDPVELDDLHQEPVGLERVVGPRFIKLAPHMRHAAKPFPTGVGVAQRFIDRVQGTPAYVLRSTRPRNSNA